jgi:hypothetical protein
LHTKGNGKKERVILKVYLLYKTSANRDGRVGFFLVKKERVLAPFIESTAHHKTLSWDIFSISPLPRSSSALTV